MTPRPQTIQIFLPYGNPQGTRVAEVTTRTVRVFDVPRSLFNEFLGMPEAKQVGIYYLFSDYDADGLATCYIGQSGNVGERLKTHVEKKIFWDRALIAVSLTDNLTETHARYLEWKSIKLAKEAGRFGLDNLNGGTKPHTPPPLQADCEEILDTIRVLVGTLGFPLFEPLSKGDQNAPGDVFLCQGRGADAKAVWTEAGMVVLKGSRCAKDPTPAATPDNIYTRRQRLTDKGVLAEDDGKLVFIKDHAFSSPSGAAQVVLFRTSNGWKEWKTASGLTLDDVARSEANTTES